MELFEALASTLGRILTQTHTNVSVLQTQTVMINGTQYQIVTPVNLVSGSAATPASAPPAVTTVHYSAAGELSGRGTIVSVVGVCDCFIVKEVRSCIITCACRQ